MFSQYVILREKCPCPYSVSLRIQSECGKIWTRKTPNTNSFHAVTSAEGHKVVLIPYCLQPTFHIFIFSHVILEVLICTSSSKNVLFIRNCFRIIVSSKCEMNNIHKTQTKFGNFYKQVFKGPRRNFFTFNTISGT